jgi:hypothetical protein
VRRKRPDTAGVVIALLFLIMAIAVVFFAPLEALTRDGRKGGNVVGGWVVLFGEPVARAVVGTVLVGLAWLAVWKSRS